MRHKDTYLSSKGHLIHAIEGKEGNTGLLALYYLLIDPKKKTLFEAALAKGDSLDLTRYGEVVTSCYGQYPTANVKMALQKYGVFCQ